MSFVDWATTLPQYTRVSHSFSTFFGQKKNKLKVQMKRHTPTKTELTGNRSQKMRQRKTKVFAQTHAAVKLLRCA